jgi:hypothetical protein
MKYLARLDDAWVNDTIVYIETISSWNDEAVVTHEG